MEAYSNANASHQLINITDNDAIAVAEIAGIGNNPSIERSGGNDNGFIQLTDGKKNRVLRIYFSGSNTKLTDNGFEVAEFCFEILSELRRIGYTWPIRHYNGGAIIEVFR